MSNLHRFKNERLRDIAIIVDETANLNLAVPAIVFGAVGAAGQRCTTTRPLIVHESCYDELIDRLTVAYGQVKVGDPLEPRTLMGPPKR